MNRYASPSLCRFLGAVFFLSAGLGSLYLSNKTFNLGIDMLNTQIAEWPKEALKFLIFSFFLASLAGNAGWHIGRGIKVESEELDFSISMIWHHIANGFMLWIIVWGAALILSLGLDKAKLFIKQQIGLPKFTFAMLGPSVITCALIGFAMLLTKQYDFAPDRPAVSVGQGYLLISTLAALPGCIVEALILHLNAWSSIPAAIVLSFILMRVNGIMMAGDRLLRQRMKQ